MTSTMRTSLGERVAAERTRRKEKALKELTRLNAFQSESIAAFDRLLKKDFDELAGYGYKVQIAAETTARGFRITCVATLKGWPSNEEQRATLVVEGTDDGNARTISLKATGDGARDWKFLYPGDAVKFDGFTDEVADSASEWLVCLILADKQRRN